MILDLEWLRSVKGGKIHLMCPKCKRKQSNMPRYGEHDPETAAVAVLHCDKCSNGSKDSEVDHYNTSGEQVFMPNDPMAALVA